MDSYVNILVLILVVGILAASIAVSPRFRKWYDQKKTDRQRKQAHAGKLLCESPGCGETATRTTPNGYFCEWDYEPMTQRDLGGGEFVTWSHRLHHTLPHGARK